VASAKYIIDNPGLLAEWDYEKNAAIGRYPETTSSGVDKKVHWKCALGHKWEATPGNRWQGQGCPFCAGKRVLAGFNDLQSQAPTVAEEWHPNKNEDLLPTEITCGSNKRVWWQCRACGNEWQTSVANRVRGTNCPVCGKIKQGQTKVQKHIAEHGSLADRFPKLLEEWDYDLNDISPQDVSFRSHCRIWWKCENCNHSWRTTVYHRAVRNSGCPACANKTTTIDNCLATSHPDILVKWNYEKNTEITPYDVTAGSSKKAWWVCDKGHEWESTVTAIVNGGICPVCCGQKVLPGYNDLATTNPELASEWHPTKNGELLPTQFTAGSSRVKIWWLCPRGHEYQSLITNRSRGSGCTICDKERKTSFPEQAIFYYLGLLTNAENRYQYASKTEIDIFLPEYNLGIEYDGYYYHRSEEAKGKELRKDSFLRSKGVRVIRVKEVTDPSIFSDTEDVIYCKHDVGYRYLKDVIEKLIIRIGLNVDSEFIENIDIACATPVILSNYLQYEKANSLASKSPDIAAEWHPSRNGYVTPEMVSYASGRKVWWLGKCGHEWQMSVDNRNHGMGCPICANKRVLVGFNDLQTTHPEIAAEWDYTKNDSIQPTDLTYGSTKKVWWVCREGHSYQATPSNRSWGKACPICGQAKRARNKHLNHILNHDCLDITHPALSVEWDYEKNEDITPDKVTLGSDCKVWWKCAKGHSYQSAVSNRVAGKGCPICSGHRIVSGINDLVTANPGLADEWHSEKNTDDPHTISPNSKKKVWWKCGICGNEWQAEIHSRNSGVGCPVCARKRVTEGQRKRALLKSGTLAEKNPQLSAQWHPTKNGEMTPTKITSGSDYKAWWLCPDCGHEWAAAVGSRNRGHGCPKCSRKNK